MCLNPQIPQPNPGQIAHVGGVLKTSGPAVSKSVPGFENYCTIFKILRAAKEVRGV